MKRNRVSAEVYQGFQIIGVDDNPKASLLATGQIKSSANRLNK